MLRELHSRYKYVFLIYDLLFIILSIYLAPLIRFKGQFSDYISYNQLHFYLIIITYILVFYIFDLYDAKFYKTKWGFIINYSYAYTFITLILAAIFYLVTHLKYGRGVMFIQLGMAYFFLAVGRYIAINHINIRIPKKRILVLGDSIGGHIIAEELLNDEYCNFLGYIGKKEKSSSFKYLGSPAKIDELITSLKPDAIVVADKNIVKNNIERSILSAKMNGIYIYDMPAMIEILRYKIPVNHIDDYWVIFSSFTGLHINQYNMRFKRLTDIVLSVAGMILSSPLFLISILIIKLESSGPVFYRQTRTGLNEAYFDIFKFRSMDHNAEADTGAVWAEKGDLRVTRFGRIIRRLRIDELPQLLNVLRGEMTIVGPRPERPEFVEMLKKQIPYYSLRHLIKPGLTGWAQINYPYGASIEDARHKLEFDLYYMRHLTLKLDISIILKTVRTILFGQGAR